MAGRRSTEWTGVLLGMGLSALLALAGCNLDTGDAAVPPTGNQPPAAVSVEPKDTISAPGAVTAQQDATPPHVDSSSLPDAPQPERTAEEEVKEGSEAPYATVDGVIDPGEYAHRLPLGGMEVHWSNDEVLLWVGLPAPATGYVSVGFDPVERKVGANFIIGYVREGVALIPDHVGTRGNLHEADIEVGGEDNLNAAAGTEAAGRTVLEFVIPLDSGDPNDRPLQPGGTYEIQVAYHLTRDDFTSWHSRHGIGEFSLDQVP